MYSAACRSVAIESIVVEVGIRGGVCVYYVNERETTTESVCVFNVCVWGV